MKKQELSVIQLFDLNYTIAADLLRKKIYPWEILPDIKEFIMAIGTKLPKDEYETVGDSIFIAKDAKIAQNVAIQGPVIIDRQAVIRPYAFIRGNAVIGKGTVVGNSTELKNVILFDGVQVPHYNYVGDSILGFRAHLGAGAITSNVKADKSLVKIHAEDGDVETGLKKVGAILGDYAEIGCNCVLNPGTVIGKNSNVYPLSSVRGCVGANCIYKNSGEIVKKH